MLDRQVPAILITLRAAHTPPLTNVARVRRLRCSLPPTMEAFRQGLCEQGSVAGQNIAVE